MARVEPLAGSANHLRVPQRTSGRLLVPSPLAKVSSIRSSQRRVHATGGTDEAVAGVNAEPSLKVHALQRRASSRNLALKWILDPSGVAHYVWLCVISVPVVYNLVFIIARAVFEDLQKKHHYTWLTLDYIGDALYLLDSFIGMRTGYLEQGILVTDSKKLAKHYFKSRQFVVDVIGVFPTDIAYVFLGSDIVAVRFNRLLRLTRVSQWIKRTSGKTRYPSLFRICILILNILLVLHWNGCIYFSISRWLGFGVDAFVYPNVSSLPWADLETKYVYSFYWSTVTLTTIAEAPIPRGTSEYLLVIANFLVGIFLFATIVGNVSNAIARMNQQKAGLQQLMDGVKLYMKLRKVSKPVKQRVIQWLDYLWRSEQAVDENSALNALPAKLRSEIAIHAHMSTLERVAIFKECEPGVLIELVQRLQLQVFSPGDYICRKGDIGREMYIVKSGMLQVLSDDEKTQCATLSEGSVFGELSILNIAGNKIGNRRTANVRSVGYSDLFVLSKDDLWETLEEYPEAKTRFVAKGRAVLEKDKLIDSAADDVCEQTKDPLDEELRSLEYSVADMSEKLAKLLSRYDKEQKLCKSRLTALETSLNRVPDYLPTS